MKKKLIDNLALLLPLAVLIGVAVYAFWFRELPRADGRITGDFETAQVMAESAGVPLFVAIDQSPH